MRARPPSPPRQIQSDAHRERKSRSEKSGSRPPWMPSLVSMAKRDRLDVRARSEQLERWKRAAAAAGALSLSAFARDALDEGSPEVTPTVEGPPSPLSLADDPGWARDLALVAAGGRRT
jgi:hypothetical protein